MSGLHVGMIVLGLVFATACCLILSSQIEQQSRDTAYMFQRSTMLMHHLVRPVYAGPKTPLASGGVIVEFRRYQQKNRTNSSSTALGASSAR